jgi:hypothetical protein
MAIAVARRPEGLAGQLRAWLHLRLDPVRRALGQRRAQPIASDVREEVAVSV